MDRVVQAGARPMTSLQYLLELQRDWARSETYAQSNASPDAVAIADGCFLCVGRVRDVEATANRETKLIDLQDRRVIPGLIDSHMYIIRGGLNYNLELRLDGVRSQSPD